MGTRWEYTKDEINNEIERLKSELQYYETLAKQYEEQDNKVTRLEKIKNKSIEEMAEMIIIMSSYNCECNFCSVKDKNDDCDDTKCKELIVKWLNTPTT